MHQHVHDRRSARRRTRRRLGTILLPGLAIAATACGGLTDSLTERAVEEVIERASDGSIDIDSDGGQVTFQDEDGTTTTFGATNEVPAAFSEHVDLPAGLSVMAVTEMSEDEGDLGFSVAGIIEDGASHDEVMARVDATLTGWEVADLGDGMHNIAEEMDSRIAERGDAALVVSVISEDVAAGPHQVSYVLVLNAD